MKPVIAKVNMKILSLRNQKRICECKTPCTTAVSLVGYNDGFMMCWNDGRKLLYDLVALLEDNTRTSWTDEDERFIIEAYSNGARYGMNTEIATQLGKSYHQVKSKVRRLKKLGKIK